MLRNERMRMRRMRWEWMMRWEWAHMHSTVYYLCVRVHFDFVLNKNTPCHDAPRDELHFYRVWARPNGIGIRFYLDWQGFWYCHIPTSLSLHSHTWQRNTWKVWLDHVEWWKKDTTFVYTNSSCQMGEWGVHVDRYIWFSLFSFKWPRLLSVGGFFYTAKCSASVHEAQVDSIAI